MATNFFPRFLFGRRRLRNDGLPDGLPEQPTTHGGFDATDFAWRVHTALIDWTKNVDTKASIILAVLVAAAGAGLREVFSAQGGLHEPAGARLVAVAAMGICGAGALLLAGWAVIPNLRARQVRREAEVEGGLIFFGHLRHLDPATIEAHLVEVTEADVRRQLARQLHVMSVIAWRKHRRLQGSLLLGLAATVAYGVARFAL